jgi:hypothetical protein
MEYRKPAIIEDRHDFLYMTQAQLGFFCCDLSGKKAFREESEDFYNYYCQCLAHNVFFDVSELEPDKCQIIWDHKTKKVAYRASKTSSVWSKLKALGIQL